MKITPKSTPVTNRALRQQIASLRDALTNETAIVERLSKEHCELSTEVTKLRSELSMRTRDLTHADILYRQQLVFQSRAHETIALLVQKMPAAK